VARELRRIKAISPAVLSDQSVLVGGWAGDGNSVESPRRVLVWALVDGDGAEDRVIGLVGSTTAGLVWADDLPDFKGYLPYAT
jgi:hypothetical protein